MVQYYIKLLIQNLKIHIFNIIITLTNMLQVRKVLKKKSNKKRMLYVNK